MVLVVVPETLMAEMATPCCASCRQQVRVGVLPSSGEQRRRRRLGLSSNEARLQQSKVYTNSRQDKTMSVAGLRCILYARIYILYLPYTRTYRRHGIYGVTVTSQSLRPRYDRHRILGSVGLVESTPQPASRSVRTFLHGSGFVQQTQRQTHAGTYTTLRR